MSPNFFAVTDHMIIDWWTPNELYLVVFTAKNLENPSADPIGVYFYAGMRRYIWMDKFWAEYNLPFHCIRRIEQRLHGCVDGPERDKLNRMIEMLTDYRYSVGPTDKDTIDNPRTLEKTFYRVLYCINAANEGATPWGTQEGEHDKVS